MSLIEMSLIEKEKAKQRAWLASKELKLDWRILRVIKMAAAANSR